MVCYIEGCSNKLVEGLQLLHDTTEAKHSSTKDAHVRKIVEIPNMKDGSGKELRRLYMIQHCST